MKKKELSQIKAIILVAVLKLERLEAEDIPIRTRIREKKPPHVHLKLIRGGKR